MRTTMRIVILVIAILAYFMWLIPLRAYVVGPWTLSFFVSDHAAWIGVNPTFHDYLSKWVAHGDMPSVGFYWDEGDLYATLWEIHARRNSLPIPYLVPILIAWLTWRGLYIRYRIRRRAWRDSHCRQCGYDLRATPNRCPECGNVASALGAHSKELENVNPSNNST